jgi:hypothetical protein
MGKFLSSLAFATALLAVVSSEASANFVCQAVGARSVGYGRPATPPTMAPFKHPLAELAARL